MKVIVAGGKLQGVEAVYLAREAGWEVVLIDKNPLAPARGLCDVFCQEDINNLNRLPREAEGAGLIIPALEDAAVLDRMAEISGKAGIPLAYDAGSFALSSSKKDSDMLFARGGIPAPLPFQQAGFPLIAKPSSGSGSRGVRLIKNADEYDLFAREAGPLLSSWVVQEYIDGPSFSVEVVGLSGRCMALQTTRLEMDEDFDCKRVLAPAGISPEADREFREIAAGIGETIGLNGIMDVEAIFHNNQFKVLEIDARLPSQTPTAVLKSTGINMLGLLAEVYIGGTVPAISSPAWEKGVIFEHVKVTRQMMEVCGEHIMSDKGPLHLKKNFFGCDEAITNYTPGSAEWVATMIYTGNTVGEAWEKRRAAVDFIVDKYGLPGCRDQAPQF